MVGCRSRGEPINAQKLAVAAPTPESPGPTDRPAPAHSRVLAAVAGAPERLLLALLWFSYVAALAYVTGLFRPVVVFPAALVVIVLAWWLHPRSARPEPAAGTRGWIPAVGSLLGLAVAGAWFLLNLPYLSERVLVSRDPDVYTLTALWLLDHTSPSIPVHDISSGVLGFGLADGALGPQGNHLVAGVSATAGWVFGQEAVFWGNLACGAAALLGLYVLGTRILGALWALVPALALAGSMPMLEFSRAPYSEPLAMTFTFLGASLLWGAWKQDRSTEYLLAGAAFGGVALARIDGTLPLLGVLVGLTVAAFVHPERDETRRRWAAPLVLLGSLPGVLIGLADVWLHSGTYVEDLGVQLVILLSGLVVAAVISLVGARLTVRPDRVSGTARFLSRAVTAAAALSALVFLVLLTRPWWFVGHDTFDNSVISTIQTREGSPVDGSRNYVEQTLQWISWYHGWPVLLIGLAGLVAWLVIGGRTKSTELLWLSALFLPSALLYLTLPNITPDQIWAMRRFLPVVIPGILLAGIWIARTLVERVRTGSGLARVGGVLLAAALAVTAVGWPLTSTRHLWDDKNLAGALAGNEMICAEIDGRPTIVTGVDTYLATVLVLCDVPAVSIPEPTEDLLAEAREELGGGEVVLATRAPGAVPWKGDQPPQHTWMQRVWERSLIGPPDEVFDETIGVSLGVVQPDGAVEPIQP